MRKHLKTLALVVAVALAFTPLAWERLLVPSAEAQFQGFIQAATLQNAATSGNGSTLDTSGNPIVAFQTTGLTGAGAVTPEGSLDGTTFAALTCYTMGSTSGTALIIASASQTIVRCNVVGIPLVRARISNAGGTVTVKALATQAYFPLGTNAP